MTILYQTAKIIICHYKISVWSLTANVSSYATVFQAEITKGMICTHTLHYQVVVVEVVEVVELCQQLSMTLMDRRENSPLRYCD